MTDYLESDGWVQIYSGSNTLRPYCESIKVKPIHQGKNKHYDGGINVGIPIFKEYVIITLEGIWINTTTKTENYILYLKTWLNSNALNIKVQDDSSGSSFLKLDGTNTIFPVMIKGGDLGNIEKMGYGDQTIYYIDKLVLEQSGTAS